MLPRRNCCVPSRATNSTASTSTSPRRSSVSPRRPSASTRCCGRSCRSSTRPRRGSWSKPSRGSSSSGCGGRCRCSGPRSNGSWATRWHEVPAVRAGRATPGRSRGAHPPRRDVGVPAPRVRSRRGSAGAARARRPHRGGVVSDEGALVDDDESFSHQIVETHARVAQADRSWTEKVCAMAAARDGSLQVAFGVGKYTNRNVFDGYAGVSRGKEQWTVRGSRRLSDAPSRIGVGPIDYEVIEPYRRVRFACAANDSCRSRSNGSSTAAVPPVLERRDRQRSRRGNRLDADVLRYHQIGVASGWVEVDGVRTEITPDTWFSDPRPLVGRAPGRRHPADRHRRRARRGDSTAGLSFRFSWSPMLLERADGTVYAIHHQHRLIRAFGYEETMVEGGVEHPDGRVEPFAALRPELRFDPVNRRVLGGTLALHDGRRHHAARSRSRRSATPASISAPASTSGSTATITANGAARCTSTASTSPTAPNRRPRAVSTRSATRSCGSTIRSAAGAAGATSRRRSPARGPTRVSTRSGSFV